MTIKKIHTKRFRETYPDLTAQIEADIRAQGGGRMVDSYGIRKLAQKYDVSPTVVTHLVLQMRWREREW